MGDFHDTDFEPGDLAPGERRLVDTPRGRFVVVRRDPAAEGEPGPEPGRALDLAPDVSEPEFVAFGAWCPHLDGPLWEGTLRGDEIGCPWHSWRYSIRTGRCTWAPQGDEEEAAETELPRARCATAPSGRLRLELEDA